MSNYRFFSKDPGWWGEAIQSLWGHLDICPLLNQFNVTSITHSDLSSLTSLKAWGDAEMFCSDITFLLVSIKEGAAWDSIYGLSTIWVNPYLARASTMEEAVKQLTTLVSPGLISLTPWCGLMGMPAMCHSLGRDTWASWTEGGTSSAACRRVSQLEVCWLLS